jgi:FKBP-type peptidyl-prolyl cis-trans isomerase SlyD
MKVAKNTVVSINYELQDNEGKPLEKSEQPISYLHGGYDGIFPAVEEVLEGKSAGDKCQVRLDPENAFGEYDAELVRVESRTLFPADEITVGMQFEGAAEGSEEFLVYTVTEVTEETVVVDANHPLAGQTLNFECTVTDVRPATPEELEHGHVHGPHGHHH